MIYFITGASGFIGKRLVRRILSRDDGTVYFLIRDASSAHVSKLLDFWNVDETRAIAVKGDVTKTDLGLSKREKKDLAKKVDHLFHLAAIYDLEVDPGSEILTNIAGTKNAIALAGQIGAKCFHHMSSIAVAGQYPGVFREDMFEEAYDWEHPYFLSKYEAEKVVRSECKIPWRIYRPGIVIGDSRSGQMDKIDGPYYFFKLIQRLRKAIPQWMPMAGIEGGKINLVPVDFVTAALDHIAHLDECDGQCFHLTAPRSHEFGDLLNTFAHAAHAPTFSIRLNTTIFDIIPRGLLKGLSALAPMRRLRKAIMRDLGLPRHILRFASYQTTFDSREADKHLKPAGIEVPELQTYAWRIWDYWERHLDPDLHTDRSLGGAVSERVVLITGGSSGIGKATAFKVARAGATTVIVARNEERLSEAKGEAAVHGLKLTTYVADLTDPFQCEKFVTQLVSDHGGVDILINNAGRSIRRSIENSYDRMHDFERTMAINYFGALRLTMALLPQMAERGRGHVINISSIGVLANAPHFSAYVASKAALEAWTRCAASEFLDKCVEFTTINMPLVRTPMIAPTKLYEHAPALAPEEAADLVVEAITRQPVRIATKLGIFGQFVHTIAPHVAQVINNTTFRMFPDSPAVKGEKESEGPTADQAVMTQFLRGVHF